MVVAIVTMVMMMMMAGVKLILDFQFDDFPGHLLLCHDWVSFLSW